MTLQGWAALAAHIKAHPVTGSPAEMRDAFDALAPEGPTGTPLTIGGVPALRFGPDTGTPVIWLHGGGLVFGSGRSHGAMVAALATRLERPVIFPLYRLAPKHPWPAPLDDALAVLSACESPVDLVGDSVGGQLAVLAALAHPGAVRRLGLISPNSDHRGASTTRKRNSPHDLMNDDAQDSRLARMSFGPDLAAHPDANLLDRALHRLPPVWITAATNEVLLDDTLLLVTAMGRAGVEVEAHIRPGLCHLWPLWPDALPESRDTLDRLAAFLSALHDRTAP